MAAPDVDLEAIASRAIGFSGASLQNLMNEAAIVAARREKEGRRRRLSKKVLGFVFKGHPTSTKLL